MLSLLGISLADSRRETIKSQRGGADYKPLLTLQAEGTSVRLKLRTEPSLSVGREVRAWGSYKCVEMSGRVLSEEREKRAERAEEGWPPGIPA